MTEEAAGNDPDSEPGRLIYVYRNGDRFRILEPSFGAVRNLRTPTQGHVINALEEIEGGRSYVAGGHGKFISLPYEKPRKLTDFCVPGKVKRSAEPYGAPKPVQIKPVKHSRILASGKVKKDPGDSFFLHIYVNGDDRSPAAKIRLVVSERGTMVAVLNAIGKKVTTLTGAVLRLHTLTGDRVQSVEQLQNGESYVAVGREKVFHPAEYGKHLCPVWHPGKNVGSLSPSTTGDKISETASAPQESKGGDTTSRTTHPKQHDSNNGSRQSLHDKHDKHEKEQPHPPHKDPPPPVKPVKGDNAEKGKKPEPKQETNRVETKDPPPAANKGRPPPKKADEPVPKPVADPSPRIVTNPEQPPPAATPVKKTTEAEITDKKVSSQDADNTRKPNPQPPPPPPPPPAPPQPKKQQQPVEKEPEKVSLKAPPPQKRAESPGHGDEVEKTKEHTASTSSSQQHEVKHEGTFHKESPHVEKRQDHLLNPEKKENLPRKGSGPQSDDESHPGSSPSHPSDSETTPVANAHHLNEANKHGSSNAHHQNETSKHGSSDQAEGQNSDKQKQDDN